MTQFRLLFGNIKQRPWLAEFLSALAGFAYFIQSWNYSHTRDSVLDEGLYLLKGYLFLTGKYQPFQANGVETNHMPLSFLIPGFFQYVFGPGLRTGRCYAISISLLFFLGTWLLIRRLGGRWWAALVTWTLVMNPMMIKVYSLAISQGLVACLLVWIIFFVVGDDRHLWQVLLGSFLAGILLMTRLNMSPVLPFLLVYIFWRYGFRLGMWAAIIGFIPVLWGHVMYYPEIMVLWAKWFPQEITPFLSQWRFNGMEQIPDAMITPTIRIKAFFQGFSLHAFAWLGVLVSWILWPQEWKKQSKHTAIFFSTLYVFLFALHAWATLGGTHCVFCFSWYQYFFEIFAILIIVVTCRMWRWSLTPLRKGIARSFTVLILVVLILGSAFGVNRTFPAGLDNWVTYLKMIRVPRFVSGRFQSGQIELWGLIANKFGLLSRYPYQQAYQVVADWLSALVVFVFSGIFLFFIWWIAGKLHKRGSFNRYLGTHQDRSALALVIILLSVWLLTPMGLLGSNIDYYDCDFNIINSYETAGRKLSDQIPPDVKVFWWGGDTQSVLLYLQDVSFFPALFNANFSKREGDPVELEKYGLWNDELFQQWAGEADVFLIESRTFTGWLEDYLTTGQFNELEPTGEIGCRGGTSLHVYMREP